MNAIGAALERSEMLAAESAASPYQLRLFGDPILSTPCMPVASLEDLPAGLLKARP